MRHLLILLFFTTSAMKVSAEEQAHAVSPTVMTAKPSLDRGKARVDVVAPLTLAGKKAVAKVNGEIVAINTFESAPDRASTSFFLPPGDVEISSDHVENILIQKTEVDALAARAIGFAKIVFKPSVFDGEKFPRCDFEQPGEIEKMLGRCVLTPTFYDADYHQVKTAAKPGRYGAIVQVKTEGGQTSKRFITLYRTPEPVNWDLARIRMTALEFPPEFGVSPAVVGERIGDVEDYFKLQLYRAISRDTDAATVIAGLAEMKAGGETPRKRNNADSLNKKWWYGLKKQTGDLRSDYHVRLPENYEKDPQKKWPLILFLHGSGERGYDTAPVKSRVAKMLECRPDLPCIVVAPQCSPDEWWSPFELNDLLDRVETEYRVDTDRVYLTGLSMGGFGSWALAAESPQRFAAVVPICGGGDPDGAGRIKDIPIWVFHGGKDAVVPLQSSQTMVDALKKIGGNVKLTVFPDAGHDSWTQTYAMPELWDWLLQQHRAGTGLK